MDMSWLQAVLLGIVQGITEFLPISSSAHLIALSWLWNNEPLPLFQNVAFHFGTLMAVVVFFYKDWLKIAGAAYQGVIKKKSSFEFNTLLPSLILGSIPAGVLGLLGKDYIETYFHNPQTIILPLVLVGLLLWLVDKKYAQEKQLNALTISSAFLIGIAQACALIPGASRSGATIIAARMLTFKRSDAAKFSFLLGTPAMFGASLLHYKDFFAGLTSPVFFLGIGTSFLVGVLSIKFFLLFLSRFGFLAFAIYRVLFAGLLLVFK